VGSKKHIGVLSGKRGGFDAMLPMLRLLDESEDFKLTLYLADMHNMEEQFGSTEADRELPNSHMHRLHPELFDDYPCARARNICEYGKVLAALMDHRGQDCLVLYGDRGESLSAAMVACQMRIPIAHIQGGDTTGTTDNNMRHAISMLSTWHFVSHQRAADRLVDMGIAKRYVYIVGDSHIDPIVEGDHHDEPYIREELSLVAHNDPLIVLLQHPDDPNKAAGEIWETLMALKQIKGQVVAIYPCSDPGYSEIVNALEDAATLDKLQVHKNLPGPMFRGLMNIADVLVGNSSCGVIEAPYVRLPTVNIGDRQRGRLQTRSTINCPPERGEIEIAILHALSCCKEDIDPEHLYGRGNTGQNVVGILGDVL